MFSSWPGAVGPRAGIGHPHGVDGGWIHWRRGLLAAMVAHFSTDIVLHAFVPWLFGVLVRVLSPMAGLA